MGYVLKYHAVCIPDLAPQNGSIVNILLPSFFRNAGFLKILTVPVLYLNGKLCTVASVYKLDFGNFQINHLRVKDQMMSGVLTCFVLYAHIHPFNSPD